MDKNISSLPLVLVVFGTIVTSAGAQDIEGFAGVKWYTSCQDALYTIAERLTEKLKPTRNLFLEGSKRKPGEDPQQFINRMNEMTANMQRYNRTEPVNLREYVSDGCKYRRDEIKTLNQNGITTFLFEYPIGGINVFTNMIFPNDQFQKLYLSFKPSFYDQLVQTFTGAYGAPDSVTQNTVQNAMGAQFVNNKAIWKRTSASIQIQKYAGKIINGEALVLTNQLLKQESDSIKERQKSGVQDVK